MFKILKSNVIANAVKQSHDVELNLNVIAKNETIS